MSKDRAVLFLCAFLVLSLVGETTASLCYQYSNCTACTEHASCGWCSNYNQEFCGEWNDCYQGSIFRPEDCPRAESSFEYIILVGMIMLCSALCVVGFAVYLLGLCCCCCVRQGRQDISYERLPEGPDDARSPFSRVPRGQVQPGGPPQLYVVTYEESSGSED